jgi:hypothetical protein
VTRRHTRAEFIARLGHWIGIMPASSVVAVARRAGLVRSGTTGAPAALDRDEAAAVLAVELLARSRKAAGRDQAAAMLLRDPALAREIAAAMDTGADVVVWWKTGDETTPCPITHVTVFPGVILADIGKLAGKPDARMAPEAAQAAVQRDERPGGYSRKGLPKTKPPATVFRRAT